MNSERVAVTELTKEDAVKLYEIQFWTGMSKEQIVQFQLFETRLCMPWDVFHEAVERVLGRGVFTDEFAYVEHLRAEYLGDRKAPTFDEVMALIPEEKRILVFTD